MNKKLRVLFCMLFAAIAVFALALVACDQDNSGSSGSGSSAEETHTHTYSSDPTVTWVEKEDGTYDLTVTLTCDDSTCGETTSITATVTSEETTAATKLAKGVRTYTGKYTYNGQEQVVTKEVEIPALATVYDAAYIETDGTGFTASEYWEGQYTIAEDTSIFDGFATTDGKVYYYNTASETPTTDNIADGYTFKGYINLATSVSSDTGSLTFTLTSAAKVTLYAKISANYNTTIVDSTDATKATFKATNNTVAAVVTPYAATLDAGTYTINVETGTSIYAIMVEGNDYTEGVWNYTESTETELEDNQFELVAETEYTFTATEAGYYTFTIPTAGANIWAGEDDYDDSTDGYTPDYIDSSYSETSFEIYLEKDATIVLYLTYADSVVVTYTVSDSAKVVTTTVPTALTTGENAISLAADDADTGISSTFTATVAGTYVFSTDDATAFMSVGSAYTQGTGVTSIVFGYPYTVTLAAGDTITIYFYSYYEATESEYTLNIQVSTTTDTVIPGSLTIGGDTIATLDPEDETNYYYLLSYTVETAGYYTFTLSGTDLTYVEVTVYDRNGSWATSTLDKDNTTVTLLYGVGDTIKVYGYLTEGAADNVTFTLNTVKESTTLTTSVPETLEIGTAGNTIVLSEADGSDRYETTFTATSAGVYTFSVDYGSDSQVSVGGNDIYGSYESSLTISYYLAANEEITIKFGAWDEGEAVYDFYISYAAVTPDELTVDVATTLTLNSTATTYGYIALVTYTATADGNYYIALGSSNSSWMNNNTVTVYNGETALTGNDYCYNLAVTKDTTYSITIVYSGNSMTKYYTYTATLTSGSVTTVTTSVPETLEVKANSIVLSTSDGKSGVSSTFKAETAGLYTFSIDSDSVASVKIGSTTLTTSVTYMLAKDQELTITFKTTTNLSGSYTFTIATATVEYQDLTIDDAIKLTTYSNAQSYSSAVNYAYVTYTATSSTAGAYYLALSSSSTIYATVTLYLNGSECTLTNNKYNVTLVADTTYNFEIVYSGSSVSGYSLYATLTSGTYTPLTTSINASSTDNVGKIVEGENAIVLSGEDASNGYAVTSFTASKDGVYTFSVDEDEDADVYFAASQSDYEYYNYSYIYYYSTETSMLLKEGDTLYIVLKTYSEEEGKYTLTLAISDIKSATLSTENVATLTVYSSGSSYVAYATFEATSDTAGDYYITISSTDYYFGGYYSYISSVTLNETEVSGDDTGYNLTIVSGTNSIVITFGGWYFNSSEEYTVTLTKGKITVIETSIPESLTIGTNDVSLDATDAHNGKMGTYTLAAGTYILSVSSDADAYMSINIYTGEESETYDLGGSYGNSVNITVASDSTIYVKYYSNSYPGVATTYVLTIATAA